MLVCLFLYRAQFGGNDVELDLSPELLETATFKKSPHPFVFLDMAYCEELPFSYMCPVFTSGKTRFLFFVSEMIH